MTDETRARGDPVPDPRCPICGKPRDARFRPFCSRLCRDRDFLSWAEGRYAIPSVEAEGEVPAPAEEE